MSMGNVPLDYPFQALFPFHNDHADEYLTFEDSAEETYTSIWQWASEILREQRSRCTLTTDLTTDLEELADKLRRVLANDIPDTEKQSRRFRTITGMTSQFWVEVQCQDTIYKFIKSLMCLEYNNVTARCCPYRILSAAWWSEVNTRIGPFVGHILSEVRHEISVYKKWKRRIEEGTAGDSPEQPPAFWNWILRDVSRYAREVLGHEMLPDPYTFEKMMWILEETYTRQRSLQNPDLFPAVYDMFDTLGENHALRILVQHLWTVERRWDHCSSSDKLNELKDLIRSTIAARYGRVAVSATGMPLAAWRGDNSADEDRINIRLSQSAYMRFGLPDANVVNSTVHETFCDSDGNLDALQWHVDISWMRDDVVVDWGELGEHQCQYRRSPPSYDEVFGNAPPYEQDASPSQNAKEHAPLVLRLFRRSV